MPEEPIELWDCEWDATQPSASVTTAGGAFGGSMGDAEMAEVEDDAGGWRIWVLLVLVNAVDACLEPSSSLPPIPSSQPIPASWLPGLAPAGASHPPAPPSAPTSTPAAAAAAAAAAAPRPLPGPPGRLPPGWQEPADRVIPRFRVFYSSTFSRSAGLPSSRAFCVCVLHLLGGKGMDRPLFSYGWRLQRADAAAPVEPSMVGLQKPDDAPSNPPLRIKHRRLAAPARQARRRPEPLRAHLRARRPAGAAAGRGGKPSSGGSRCGGGRRTSGRNRRSRRGWRGRCRRGGGRAAPGRGRGGRQAGGGQLLGPQDRAAAGAAPRAASAREGGASGACRLAAADDRCVGAEGGLRCIRYNAGSRDSPCKLLLCMI
jgi:hypothetical protein